MFLFIYSVWTLLTKLKRSQIGLDSTEPAFEELTNHKKAPTPAEITLRLTDEKNKSKNPTNSVDWVSDGIKAQNDQ